MADIHVHEKLDTIDYIMVSLYRVSFITIGGLILWFTFVDNFHFVETGGINTQSSDLISLCFRLLVCNVVLSACCVHLYDKTIRYLLLGSALFSMCWVQFSWFPQLAFGALLVTLCGLSVKEYYCFRLRIIRITPFILVALWVSVSLLPWLVLSQILGVLSAALLIGIGVAKCRQPFDFDIGDRTRYQL